MSGILTSTTRELLGTAGGGGGGAVMVAISDKTINKTGNGTVSVSATVNYNSSGTVTNHTGATLETWLVSGVNSDYEIRATFQSGQSPTGDAMNTWLALSTSRAWALAMAPGTADVSVFLIEIRLAASPFTVLDSATITLNVSNVT